MFMFEMYIADYYWSVMYIDINFQRPHSSFNPTSDNKLNFL